MINRELVYTYICCICIHRINGGARGPEGVNRGPTVFRATEYKIKWRSSGATVYARIRIILLEKSEGDQYYTFIPTAAGDHIIVNKSRANLTA